MPEKWDAHSERLLLLCVIRLLSPAPPNWEQVANMMGEGYTAEAVRQKYRKLKNSVASGPADIESSPSTSTSQKNPKKRGKNESSEGNPVKEGNLEGKPAKRVKNDAVKYETTPERQVLGAWI